MRITVTFFVTLREITGKGKEQIELSSVITFEELLNLLAKKYGRPFTARARSDLQFLINGRNITTLQGYETMLEEGDSVTIFPVIVGG